MLGFKRFIAFPFNEYISYKMVLEIDCLFADCISSKKQVLLLEEVQKLNKENAEKSDQQLTCAHLDQEAAMSSKNQKTASIACVLTNSQASVAETHEVAQKGSEEELGGTHRETMTAEKETGLDVEDVVKEKAEELLEAMQEAADDKQEPKRYTVVYIKP